MNTDELAKYFFDEAEKIFGKSVSEWTYGGIEINDMPPCLIYYPETSTVKISLSNKVLDDNLQLRFQLAHEVCHSLYPAMNIDTLELEIQNVLNEGISTLFSIAVIQNDLDLNDFLQTFNVNSKSYYDSFLAVNELLGIDKDAILKLRNIEPYINRIKYEHFFEAGLAVNHELKNSLLAPFQ